MKDQQKEKVEADIMTMKLQKRKKKANMKNIFQKNISIYHQIKNLRSAIQIPKVDQRKLTQRSIF